MSGSKRTVDRGVKGGEEIRAAIYTRKSSEEGLEQDFNSLDAQREAGENFVAARKHEGWVVIQDRYDDGGYSGGTLERPALQKLLADIRDGKIDIVVVYKIDRLSRSLMDFAQLAALFEEFGVSFVSVTQSFNTADAMGKLMLNILLSFAQFERELTGERIRDKFAASKKRGMFMGGPPPLGYRIENRALIVVPEEAETVRKIYELYLQLGSVRLLQEELARLGLKTKSWTSAAGKSWGGQTFTRGHIYQLLGNALYIGEISHKGVRYPGLHDAIIDRPLWNRVQKRLADNAVADRTKTNAREPTLLAGLLFDEDGNRLTATHAVKGGVRYRYYAARPSQARGAPRRDIEGYRIAATEIEPAVIREISAFLRNGPVFTFKTGMESAAPSEIAALVAAAAALADEFEAALPGRRRELLLEIVGKVILGDDSLAVHLDRARLNTRLLGEFAPESRTEEPIVLEGQATLTRRGVETRLVVEAPDGQRGTGADPNLVRAVALGRAWYEELVSGRAKSFGEIGKRVGVQDRYVARLVDLAFLAPDLVEDILEGQVRPDVTLAELTVDGELPLDWMDQRQTFTGRPGKIG